MSIMQAQAAVELSVIVPCRGQMDCTRECVRALLRHTTVPWELIVVDDASEDGTAAYATGLVDAGAVPTQLIRHAAPCGFPAACNAGLMAARGQFLVLLNNDAVVTSDWAQQLMALIRSNPSIGLAGPMTNFAPPPQQVADVPYRDLAGMHQFAAHWGQTHRGQWFTTPKLSGFCLMLSRQAYERIGGLDPRYGLGFFDDDDLAERARRAGYELAVAHDLFVHHHGGRTFAGLGLDTNDLLQKNLQLFAEKWGPESVSGMREVTVAPWIPSANEPAISDERTERARVSLTMIVKNEEANLPACLDSVAGVFDEIVVVDTGSTDRTREIATERGARVFDFVWVDDFAAARNAALARATGDYAFWLDADDVVEPEDRERLVALLGKLRADRPAAFVVRCECDPDEKGGGGQTVVDHVRLFPVGESIRWTYRVHEQILPALARAGVPSVWTDFKIRHTGYGNSVVRGRKLARDEQILLAELEDRPADPFVLFNLGMIAQERQDWRQALAYLERSLAGSRPTDSITRKLYALISRCHLELGDLPTSLAACERGLANDPHDAELMFRKAVAHLANGQPAAAESCWRRVLELRRPERFSSVDQGIYGHLTRRNLARLAAARNDLTDAALHWQAVLAERPGDLEAIAELERLNSRSGLPVEGGSHD